MAGLLNTQGQLEAQLGRPQAASGAYREALAWLQRAPRDAGLEVTVRLNLAELHLEAGRFLDGEEEMRRAEQVAIAGNLTGRLAQIYTLIFFQAEDGIRDLTVTGVQTCALPI